MFDKNYEKVPAEDFVDQRAERIKQGEAFGLMQREKKTNKKKRIKVTKRNK
jgi:hypothetical protein